MTLQEKIGLIVNNLDGFSATDKRQRKFFFARMHSDFLAMCDNNKEVFNIADGLGLFNNRETKIISDKGFVTAERLGLI
jgi:hypothetical protein